MRQKIQKYTANISSPILLQPGDQRYENIKGKRQSDFFHNTNPISLELACGKGEYTTTLGTLFPEKNYIGIDIKGDRMHTGITYAQQHNKKNIGFLRTIIHHLEKFFAPQEVDEIWIIHPDPRPKNRDAKRRLTHPRFLDIYSTILKPNGVLHLKTDDTDLFHFSLEMFSEHGREIQEVTFDLHQSQLYVEHYGIKTHYEQIFMEQGRTIKYAQITKLNYNSKCTTRYV